METSKDRMKICILVLYMCIAAIYVTHCDARRTMQLFKDSKDPKISIMKHMKKTKVMKHLEVALPFDYSNTNPYGVSSPFSLPPFDSLAPNPLPENAPPISIYSPTTPLPPSTTIPTPMGYNPSLSPASSSPPSPSFYYIPPILPLENPPQSPSETVPSPPKSSLTPNPPESGPSQPEYGLSPPIYIPSPPIYGPSPPSYVPSPPSYSTTPGGGFVPSPPLFQPPVVFPPPAVPPPPQRGQSLTLWCVAKPSVPDPIIEEAMNYACGFGANCESIQPIGSCYQPNTLYAHASYAFNSYWQRTKVGGGTCNFGGTAILVTVDPTLRQTGAACDHPIDPSYPQGAYL